MLDGPEAVEVGGLRFLGIGDPRFTPDKETRDGVAPASVSQVGLAMASGLRAATDAGTPVDVAVVHDGAAADEMDGTVPVVLSGHYHRPRAAPAAEGTLSFFQGSTGASGLRGLEGPALEKPTPVRASVLYFDRSTRSLQAWDDITLGGLGLVSAKIERRIVGQQFPELAPTVSPPRRRRPRPRPRRPIGAGLSRRPMICGLLWQPAGASPMLSESPTAIRRRGPPPSSSSGPGRCPPFKAVARVRIPLGARQYSKVLWSSLECSPPCQGGGRGFKSRQDRWGRQVVAGPRPGSSVGTSVRLKIGRSAVRPRPWPPQTRRS